MLDSNPIMFPSPSLDWTDPAHVAEWISKLPPADGPPNRLPIAHFGVKIEGRVESFRITREALEAIDGANELSSSALLQLHEAEIERQCRALFARGDGGIGEWVLDAADLI
jgi:hypothetical protein